MVRPFPRTTRRRLAALLVTCGLLAGVAAVPLAQAEDLKDKKHNVEKKIRGAKGSLDESSKELQQATAELQRAQVELSKARGYLAETRVELAAAQALDRRMQAELDAAVRRLEAAQAELGSSREHVADQSLVLRQIVVDNYQSGSTGLMGLTSVLNSQDPAELTEQLSSMQTVVDKQSVVLDRLEATKVMLTVKQREVKAAKIEVAKKRKAAAENLRVKEALEIQAEQAEQQVEELVSLRAQTRALAMRAKRADLRTLAKLEQERNRIAQLIQQQASRGSGYRGPSTGNGFLDYPVPGRITSGFGWRTHPIWGYRSLHDGVDFGVGCGTPIRAAASGEVLQTYYQSAWGNRLILDHGVHFGVGVATIYNHLSGYAVTAGQSVKRGQVIGYVGNTGWSTGCHLHFTVLENGRANDPMRWF